MKRKTKKEIAAIILYALLALMVIVSIFPIFFCLSASFRTQEDLFTYMFPFSVRSLIPTKFTSGNYTTIFREYHFLRPIINTMVVTISTIMAGCIVNSVAAFAFSCFEFKGKKILYPLILVSFMVPFEAIAIPLYGVVDHLKMVDTYYGMILPAVADGLVTFLFIQFFKDIPSSLIEAARVDGARWPVIFAKIIMPISKPVFITAGLMIFMNQWNSYLWPLLVARSKEIRTIQIALSQFKGERTIQWTYIYAGALISALIPICLFLPFQKYFVEGITSGGVKG